MISEETCLAILDTINNPIVFADNEHVIRYLNKPAMKFYYEKRGYSDLIEKSIFDCHSEKSQQQIINHHKRLQAGENEISRIVARRNSKITVVAVRDKEGSLLGYYERFERVGDTS
jgi:nitrogen-specific signal transduction histidine kinase